MSTRKYSKIPIGIDDFAEMRTEKYCYIDKSMFIYEIVEGDPNVMLITRPRRFGKTINMSMLYYFLNCNLPSFKNLFEVYMDIMISVLI